MMAERMTILAPEGMLGYGIPLRSMAEGLKRDPEVLAVDAGSTDPGPYYLGAGVAFTSRRAFKRLKGGDVYEFNIHHLVTVDDPLELFPIEMIET